MVSTFRNGEQDIPTVREAVTPLFLHAGGTVTLTAGESRDIVRVANLRRFDSLPNFVRGTHDSTTVADDLVDSSADFLSWGVAVGDEIINVTQSDVHSVTRVVSATRLEVDTTGGFANNDAYTISKTGVERAGHIRRFSISTDSTIYVRYDGEAHADNYDVEIAASESYFEENVFIASRISVIGASSSATPQVRYTAWGV